jgi:hypothetical protein
MDLNKPVILIISAFLAGTIFGVIMLEDLDVAIIRAYSGYFYFLFLIVCIIYISVQHLRRSNYLYLFPLISFIMYVPVNFLAGINLENVVGSWYYADFPRYILIVYYALFLAIFYLIAWCIDKLLKSRKSSIVFLIADILSLAVLPILAIATYFVSPA